MNDSKISKFLSLILRHQPELAGLTLDPNGWVDIDRLIDGCAQAKKSITREQLERVVEQSDKQRFTIKGNMIRANQGHSVEVELDLKSARPPQVLFHGSVQRFMQKISAEGLQKMNRHHVHLSPDIETAEKVGSRRGEPVILEIDSEAMYKDGHIFMCSLNGVWLTENVPYAYIRIIGRDD